MTEPTKQDQPQIPVNPIFQILVQSPVIKSPVVPIKTRKPITLAAVKPSQPIISKPTTIIPITTAEIPKKTQVQPPYPCLFQVPKNY